jgi:hypothetical protein
MQVVPMVEVGSGVESGLQLRRVKAIERKGGDRADNKPAIEASLKILLGRAEASLNILLGWAGGANSFIRNSVSFSSMSQGPKHKQLWSKIDRKD